MLLSVCALAMLTYCSAAICSTNSSKIESLYIVDQLNYRLRIVSPLDTTTSTLAGNGVSAAVDGYGSSASFKTPGHSALSRDENTLYVTDGPCIRSVRLDDGFYQVKTIIGNCLVSGNVPGSVSVARLGDTLKVAVDVGDRGLFIADFSNGRVNYFNFTNNILSYFVGATGARFTYSFYQPQALFVSNKGDYVLFAQPNCIFIVNLTSSQVGVFAGNPPGGTVDGVGTSAKFLSVTTILAANETMLYVADGSNRILRVISLPDITVRTISIPYTSDFLNIMSLSMNGLVMYSVVGSVNYNYYVKVNISARAYTRSGNVVANVAAGYVDGNIASGSVRFNKPTSCNIGNFYNLSTCSRCDVGKYQNISEKTLMCVTCPIATYASYDFTACQTCPMGTYSTATAASACQRCVTGKYATSSDVTACTDCPAGQYGAATGATACINCVHGTFSSMIAANSCPSCAAGKFGSNSGLSVCANCTAGSFTPAVTYSVCSLCGAGKYSTYSAGTACDSCPPGTFSTAIGRSNATCTLCAPGTYTNNFGLGACTLANPGWYIANAGSSAQSTSCPVGTYTTGHGFSACTLCAPGMFVSSVGSAGCNPCSTGSYASGSGASFCTGCTAGKFSTLSGSRFEANCTACIPATYTAFSGLSTCSNCSSGYFNGNTQASICSKCSIDSYSSNGVTVCTRCSAGSAMTYSATQSVLFVSDRTNYRIRQVWQINGSVTTVAGSGVSGNANGNGLAATFSSLGQITLSYDQKLLYIVDNFCIRSMTTTDGLYTVRTVVGVCGNSAQVYGSVSVARLSTIYTLCVDPDGAGLYITDSNYRVKYFEFHTQTLRVFAGSGGTGSAINGFGADARIHNPQGLYMSTDKAFMLVSYGYGIFHINMSTQYVMNIVGTGSTVGGLTGIGTTSSFSNPAELVMNSKQTMIYMSDQSNTRIRAITYPNINAQFLSPSSTFFGLSMEPDDVRLYYVDNTAVRFVNLNTSVINLVSGSTTAGYVDGTSSVARYRTLFGVRLAQLTSTSCTQCTLGKFVNATFTVCTDCIPGTFNPVNGSSACTSCPPGTYASASQSTACTQTPIGSFTIGGASFFTTCPTGTFAPSPGASTCTGCPAGSFLPSLESIVCTLCSAGNFSLGNSMSCSPCQPGVYSSADGATTCFKCLAGSFSFPRATQCLACSRGTYSLDSAGVCLNCNPGNYTDMDSATACLSCQSGLYSTTQQATACLICTAGTYSQSAASTCLACSAGNYVSTASASACLACQPGTYAPAQQATECLLCPPGQYASVPGISNCPLCNEGTYASSPGTVNCSKCSVCLAANTGLQKTCPQGATINNVTCGCAENLYGIAGDCHPCPSNTQTISPNAESLLDCRCIPGYVCQYSKRINVRLTLTNITWDLLNVTNIANSQIIDAIAAAAGVPRKNVVINGVVGSGRRMMKESDFESPDDDSDTEKTTVLATVWGASSLDVAYAATLLDPYLIDSFSWTHDHSVRVAKVWWSLM